MLEWLESEPRPDVINLPYTLLIGLAAPLKKALDAPVCCTLQGEDLFLEGLHGALSDRGRSSLIRKNIPHVDCFLGGERLLRRIYVPLSGNSGHKMEVARRGREHGRLSRRRAATEARVAERASASATSRASRRKRDCTCWPKPIASCGQQEPNCTLEAAGYMAPEHRAYLDGIERQLRQWDLPFHYRGVLDRAQKIAFSRKPRRAFNADRLRRSQGNFRPGGDGGGRSVCAAASWNVSRKWRERTGGGILVEPENPREPGSGLLTLSATRSCARAWREELTRSARALHGGPDGGPDARRFRRRQRVGAAAVSKMLEARDVSKSYATAARAAVDPDRRFAGRSNRAMRSRSSDHRARERARCCTFWAR